MLGVSGKPVVTTLVCFLPFCTRDCGCIGRPAFPTPSLGGKFCRPRAHRAAGTRSRVSRRHCEKRSDEAIQNPSTITSRHASSLRKQGPITTGSNGCTNVVEQRLSK
jgi:hypothetical protein